jgi:hypothetical protein
MACIFLKGALYKVCMAYDDLMVLSLEELEKYCENDHNHLCPIYQRFQKDGAKISVDEHHSFKVYSRS